MTKSQITTLEKDGIHAYSLQEERQRYEVEFAMPTLTLLMVPPSSMIDNTGGRETAPI